MKPKFMVCAITLIVGVSFFSSGSVSEQNPMSGLQMANITALSGTESGSKCPNGCSNIGWGWNKILECDCNYDHFSCCDKWGC